ncbi:CMRF35-like molecule 3 [Channa argus]|uniref:CMRF35-like molecule 3 n=2 Tax=Channa argus TaxID=215402 RepID=A0A6G1Q4G4_CHAAH|nr:CMRF35-like molecule 3 [Channa argus]
MKDTVYSVQLSAPEMVTGSYGGSVTISCQYDPQLSQHTKYWCKGAVYDLCVIVVKTPKNRPSNTTTIADDKEAGVFTVTMNSLSKSDEDMYWCVIAKSGRNVYTGVSLKVLKQITPTNSSLGNYESSWWAILRWILFLLMLSCMASTSITVWRKRTAEKISQHQRFHHNISIIYV